MARLSARGRLTRKERDAGPHYGLTPRDYVGQAKEGGRGDPLSTASDSATADQRRLRDTVECLARYLGRVGAQGLPGGSAVNREALEDGTIVATHVTLWPLPRMTIEEAVSLGLMDGAGLCEGVYRATVKGDPAAVSVAATPPLAKPWRLPEHTDFDDWGFPVRRD